MKAAVLCPGPSLSEFAGRTDYDLVIGVNRAATEFRCDYVSLFDPYTFGMCAERGWKGRPTIIAARDVYEQMCRQFPAAVHFPFLERSTAWLNGSAGRWYTKGLTTAIVVAWLKGADTIDCYGVDWFGTEDFDGFTDPRQKRDRDRWRREIDLAKGVRSELLQRNVTIAGLPGISPERGRK